MSSSDDECYCSCCTKDDSDDSDTDDKKIVFISIFYHKNHTNNINYISSVKEIQDYREKYTNLKVKSAINIKNIWNEVKIKLSIGQPQIPLKYIVDELSEKIKPKKLEIKQVNKQILYAQKNKNIISKVNFSAKNIVSNKSPIEKETCAVSNKLTENNKAQDTNDILKSDTGEILDTKANNISNVSKANVIENLEKIIAENKTEKKSKKKENAKINQSILKTKFVLDDKTKSTDTKYKKENEIEQNAFTDSNEDSSINDITSNTDLNSKNFKLEASLKVSTSEKIILLSNSNNNENPVNKIDLKSNENKVFENLSKKQLKRRRQREKKSEAKNTEISTSRDLSLSSTKSCNEENVINISSNENVKEESVKPKEKKFTKLKKNKTLHKSLAKSEYLDQDTEESENEKTNSSENDLDLRDTEYTPSFIADIIKRKDKGNQTWLKPVKNSSTKKRSKTVHKEQEETKVNKIEYRNMNTLDKNDIINSKKYAEQGVKMILANDIMGGLDHLTVAITCNPSDYRHYLNRSYCYLRMNQPVDALADAQYVIRSCSNIGHLFIANIRAGQALSELKKYKQAETFLKEATSINPTNIHAKRQLMRVKITQIMNLGYKEKDALLALQKYPCVSEAIDYLEETQSIISIYNSENDRINDYNLDDMIFSSDDEEESHNFETLNNMLNYRPGKIKLVHLVAKPVNPEFLITKNCDKNNKTKTTPDSNKKLPNNTRAIWVGSLTSDITEQMLRKKFKQFGNIVSIYRPCNVQYAFINFEKSEDVTNALMNTSEHELAGVKLVVRSGTR